MLLRGAGVCEEGGAGGDCSAAEGAARPVAPAQLWVTSALPMVRDVEVSLAEQLVDHVHTFLMAPAGLY